MRKTLTVLALAAATTIAVLAGTGSANAAVTFDGSTGHVDKGDVQRVLGWNNGDFDTNVGSLKFTAGNVVQGSYDHWSCSDGSVGTRGSEVTQSRTVTATKVLNANGKQITGFDLSVANYGSYVSGKYVGDPYVGYCATGSFTGFLPHEFTTSVVNGDLKVNGVSLPNTPVV